LRFQLIEGRAIAQSDIKITFEDLKAFHYKKISDNKWHNTDKQTDEEVQGIGTRFVKQDEVKKLSDQVVAEIVKLFKEKANQQLKSYL
jgi:trigger factor